ncbi:MAG: hypothetical protein PHN55_11855, partial [Dysgonamonadaceae bacterium]|nr:hypothetical protein [Dysgonamonadaceae bacterium]
EMMLLAIDNQKKASDKILVFQQDSFEKEIAFQQKTFESKFEETAILVDEIKNLSHIKHGINGFKDAISKQNEKIDALTKEIHNLAKSKSIEYRSHNGGVGNKVYNSTTNSKKKNSLTKRIKRGFRTMFKSVY